MVHFDYRSIFDEISQDECLETFIEKIERIEKFFTYENCKKLGGRGTYYVLCYYRIRSPILIKTTISDLVKCYPSPNLYFQWIMDFCWDSKAIITMQMWRPNRKFYKDLLKFPLPNTMAYRPYAIGIDPSMDIVGGDIHLFAQREKYLTESCDRLFDSNDDSNDAWIDIMENCMEHIDLNHKYWKSGIERPYRKDNDVIKADSLMLQFGISALYDARNSWGVVYQFNDKNFIFPMDESTYRKIFKDRERINGKKEILPNVIKTYKRKNGTVVRDHLRATNNDIIIGNRHFKTIIGDENIERIRQTLDSRLDREHDACSTAVVGY